MAKQLVNPIERHVEKIVLVITGVLLIAVVVGYVFTSPNKIPLGSEPVTPGGIDARLVLKANEVLDRIKNARPQARPHDPLYADFAAALGPGEGGPLPLAVALSPAVPLIDSPEGVAGRATLVKVRGPEKPAYTLGRNTLLVKDPQGNEIRQPTDWVTISVKIDVRAQSELQRKAWGATKANVIFVPPEVERRMRRPDGSWSDDDWRPITCWPALTLPAPPNLRMLADGDKTVVSTDDQRTFEKYDADLSEPPVQLATIRPLPPAIVDDGHRWRFPLITSYEDVLREDDEFLHAKDVPLANPDDRYGLKSVEPAKPVKPGPQTQAEILNRQFEDARGLLESARKTRDKNQATTAYNEATTIVNSREAPPDLKEKASRLQKEADQLVQDIARETVFGKKPGQQPEAKTDSTKPVREKLPHQQTWAHDWAANSVVNGATYQYRIRIRTLNRLAGYPESFQNPQDAGVIFIAGEWSEPTDPITIPQASLFFVTRDDVKRREIGVEFYRWYDGVWITSRAAKFNEGNKLAYQTRVAVPGIPDRNEVQNALVDFAVDATLLSIDFARSHRERKAGTGAEGVKFGPVATGTSAVFVDSNGQLSERVVALDKAHPAKKKVEIYTPPKR